MSVFCAMIECVTDLIFENIVSVPVKTSRLRTDFKVLRIKSELFLLLEQSSMQCPCARATIKK